MVLSQEDNMNAHPYWYARIIGIYHTLVRHESSPDPILIEFLLTPQATDFFSFGKILEKY
jgi:hypothetical protein